MTVDWKKMRENKDDFKKAVNHFTCTAFPNIQYDISNCLVFEREGSVPIFQVNVIWRGKTILAYLFLSDNIADRNSWADVLGRYANRLMMAVLEQVGGLIQ